MPLSEMGVKRSTSCLVTINVKIDRFVTDTMRGVFAEIATDFFGTPLLASEVVFNDLP